MEKIILNNNMLKNCSENNLQIPNPTILERKVNNKITRKNKDRKSKNI
jgi:hypothetical protein